MQIVVALVAHTNVGKTTLARTLLGRDIGEVRDAPHVTEFVEEALLLHDDASGHELLVADAPGFADSRRLVRRLRGLQQPIGWLLSQVWDRWRERPFFATQQALRLVRERASVVLYLVDASQAEPTHLAPEMELLAWFDRPVLVLLNQLGAPREAALEAAEVAGWRERLARWPLVRDVLPLDAFARCWVQEARLWRALEPLLAEPAQRHAMAALAAAWQRRAEATFAAAMTALADGLAATLLTRVPLADEAAARRALLDRADAEARRTTARLLALHGLPGRAEGEVMRRVAEHAAWRERLGEGRAALLGGAISGALTGLKADLASGGLTLGGGMLAGGILGALGAAGVARGINVLRGTERSHAGWPPQALLPLAEASLLRYLAVAHFGRGRGEWAEGESPPHWAGVVQAALQRRRDDARAIEAGLARWSQQGDDGRAACALAAEPLLAAAARDVLATLYPDAAVAAAGAPGG